MIVPLQAFLITNNLTLLTVRFSFDIFNKSQVDDNSERAMGDGY